MEIEKLVLLLVGGLIGFIASILKDYFVEKTKKKYKDIDFKREKLEELYILIHKTFLESIKPIELRNNITNNDDCIKSSLITKFYFPSINKAIDEYSDISIEINQKIFDNKALSSDEMENFIKEHQKVIDIIVSESKKYCEI